MRGIHQCVPKAAATDAKCYLEWGGLQNGTVPDKVLFRRCGCDQSEMMTYRQKHRSLYAACGLCLGASVTASIGLRQLMKLCRATHTQWETFFPYIKQHFVGLNAYGTDEQPNRKSAKLMHDLAYSACRVRCVPHLKRDEADLVLNVVLDHP